jgi:hypothetical protein
MWGCHITLLALDSSIQSIGIALAKQSNMMHYNLVALVCVAFQCNALLFKCDALVLELVADIRYPLVDTRQRVQIWVQMSLFAQNSGGYPGIPRDTWSYIGQRPRLWAAWHSPQLRPAADTPTLLLIQPHGSTLLLIGTYTSTCIQTEPRDTPARNCIGISLVRPPPPCPLFSPPTRAKADPNNVFGRPTDTNHLFLCWTEQRPLR